MKARMENFLNRMLRVMMHVCCSRLRSEKDSRHMFYLLSLVYLCYFLSICHIISISVCPLFSGFLFLQSSNFSNKTSFSLTLNEKLDLFRCSEKCIVFCQPTKIFVNENILYKVLLRCLSADNSKSKFKWF